MAIEDEKAKPGFMTMRPVSNANTDENTRNENSLSAIEVDTKFTDDYLEVREDIWENAKNKSQISDVSIPSSVETITEVSEVFKQYWINILKNDGVNIFDYDYKKSKSFNDIKNSRMFSNSGSMNLEEFIERYLLSKNDLIDTYDSIYDMGNPYELSDDECQDTAMAFEIIFLMDKTMKKDILPKAKKPSNQFNKGINTVDREETERADKKNKVDDLLMQFARTRKRLKTYMNFDIDLYQPDDIKYKCEIQKIIYLFYIFENKYYPKTNILELISEPTMENIDNSFLGMRTYNGKIIKHIKDSLEKEITVVSKFNIKNELYQIVSIWDSLLDESRLMTDYSEEYGYKNNIQEIINLLNSDTYVSKKDIITYIHSPIETLYLKILQYEYLGNIKDILFVNNYHIDSNYHVPLEYIQDMKSFESIHISVSDVEKYIYENALNLSKYVYLRSETDKEERRRIRHSAKKVLRFLPLCTRARPLYRVEDHITRLLIISCLQAILIDSQNETFDHIFYGYENHMRRKPQVQGALKTDEPPDDALSIYWNRKVMDHWYANIGRYEARLKLRELENVVDNILLDIFTYTNIEDMQEIHNFYFNKLPERE